MRNISDIIEHHLKQIIEESQNGYIEIQRNDIAGKFECVPSQINYVISTRFTLEKGYIVESKRGGGGYIRIRKIDLEDHSNLFQVINDLIGNSLNQSAAEDIIQRLLDEKIINEREARIMKSAVSRQVLHFSIPVRDQLRAKMLRAMITAVFSQKGGE
ncbi:MAG: CtsR family transcriptional regulator [Bacillaceae bacterium]|nr:CtsR family transcriptional regulator [Bacillaceae bacterium]